MINKNRNNMKEIIEQEEKDFEIPDELKRKIIDIMNIKVKKIFIVFLLMKNIILLKNFLQCWNYKCYIINIVCMMKNI